MLLALARTPKPLVVVLHGDREHARDAAARWRSAVDAHGWTLLALDVPTGNSWWRWNGDPQWVIDRANAVPHRVAYLIGWSGGATYIGMHAAAWHGTFAALVLHGGGMAPDDDTCPDNAPSDVANAPSNAPSDVAAYFLVGDRNPNFALAKGLRAYLERCHGDVVWDLVKGADHAHEEKALTRAKANDVLDWLATKQGSGG